MRFHFKIQNMPLLDVQGSEFSLFPTSSVFNFISCSRSLPHLRTSIRISSPIKELQCLTLSTPSPSAVSLSESLNDESFVVSYLVNSCGLAPESALSKARFVKFNDPDKLDSVLAFLEKHGFTKTQISRIVGRYPRLLLCNPEKTLLPKLEFLSSVGFSRKEITIIISKEPPILKSSLEKVVVHSFNILRNLLESDDKTIDTVRRYPRLLAFDPGEEIIKILREAGVPPKYIVVWLASLFGAHKCIPEDYKKTVEEVKGMGFDPATRKFIWAIRAMRSMSKSTWDQKIQIFKKYGWSDRDIWLAFEKNPKFIMSSEDKIMAVMDFLVNRMGVDAATVANYPTMILMSLEKRIVPRCLIYQALLEKELARKRRKLNINTLLTLPKKQFLVRIIKPYENEAPELMSQYQKMLDS